MTTARKSTALPKGIQRRVTAGGSVSYRVQVRLKGHAPESASFERVTDAKEWQEKTKTDMRQRRHFGTARRRTFDELATEYKPHAKNAAGLEYWRGIFGKDTLNNITPARIAKERDKLLNEAPRRFDRSRKSAVALAGATRATSTVNRYLASLSVALSFARKELQWIEKNPCESIRKPKENAGRVRFLSDDERVRLLAACKPHADLYLAVVLALTTGGRQAEIMGLRYGQIDFKRKVITLPKTKNGETRSLPLVGAAFTLLQDRAKVRDLKDDRVFPPTVRAKKSPYLDLRDPWVAALKAAKIENFHWHDLRHTAASEMAMSGVSLVEIAKILGHRTMQMVARYSHLSSEHIVKTGEQLAERLGI